MCSLTRAEEIMGRNFIGRGALSAIGGHFAVSIPDVLPDISFDESTLVKNGCSHLLLFCPAEFSDGTKITIETIRNKISSIGGEPCFYNQDWYLNEKFIKVSLEPKWLLLSKELPDESRAMSADKVVAKYSLHSAVELTFAFFVYFFISGGKKLWNNDYVWCSDVDDKGDQIYVGRYTDASGLNVDGFEIHRHLRIKKNYGVV